jgi:hypothetical protein
MEPPIMTEKVITLEAVTCQMQRDISEIKKMLWEFIDKVEDKYVRKEDLAPYKRVLGVIGSVVIAGIAWAVLKLIIK